MKWYWDFVNWLENNQADCLYKKYFGVECPGCGIQRSFIALLKGNFIESFQTFPALIPLLIMFAFLILHIFFRFKNGANILKYLFILNATILTISYIYKFLTQTT